MIFFYLQLFNIVLLGVIIPGFWSYYYKAISALLMIDPINLMFYTELVFPRAAKCTYEPYGPSGSIQKFDAFCLLPLNILNQKLFIIVWMWYIIQMVISILNLLYWIIVSCNENIRIYILCQKTMKTVPRKYILYATRQAHLDHFFVLNQIAKNTNPETFVELISNLAAMNQNASEING